jgi:hypothetical protein
MTNCSNLFQKLLKVESQNIMEKDQIAQAAQSQSISWSTSDLSMLMSAYFSNPFGVSSQPRSSLKSIRANNSAESA